jgi:hypothetical protein
MGGSRLCGFNLSDRPQPLEPETLVTGLAAATLSYTAPAEGVSRSGDRIEARLLPKIAYPREVSAATDQYAGLSFDRHFMKLSAITQNRDLWPEGADEPSENAAAWATAMLEQLLVDQLSPTRVVASAEGGIAICFIRGDKYADIEFLNTGKILGVISNRRDRPSAWEIEESAFGLARASLRIREFLDAPTPKENVSKRPRYRLRFSSTT